jgi:hypothetical protein
MHQRGGGGGLGTASYSKNNVRRVSCGERWMERDFCADELHKKGRTVSLRRCMNEEKLHNCGAGEEENSTEEMLERTEDFLRRGRWKTEDASEERGST